MTRKDMGGHRASLGVRALLSGVLTIALLLTVLLVPVGCSRSEFQEQESQNSSGGAGGPGGEKTTIVCTAFPQYDWTLNLLGARAGSFTVVLLNDKGADMHSFQPTASDMVRLSDCDLFIHNGGFSESWVPAALTAAGNRGAKVLTLLDVVDKMEESDVLLAGRGHDHEHEHGISATDGGGADGGGKVDVAGVGAGGGTVANSSAAAGGADVEYDEHLWLSLRCASQACQAIAKALTELDPAGSADYQANLAAYQAKLSDLDSRYEAAVKQAREAAAPNATPMLLFADRFPFLYLTADYDLAYGAAFPGCSAESEASFQTILALAEELEEHRLPAILILTGSKPDLAETVLRAAGRDAKILQLESMQSVTARQIKDGFTYLKAMEENLTVLKAALGLEA